QLEAAAGVADSFWRTSVASPPSSIEDARRRLLEAQRCFEHAAYPHMLATVLAQMLFRSVSHIAAAAPPDDAMAAVGGQGREEVHVARDLWETAMQRMTIDDFLRDHGFHGTDVGELSNPSWREEPAAIAS